MSLINDLLRDLDERRGGNRERHEAFEGLAPVQEPRQGQSVHVRSWLPWILLAVAVLSAASLLAGMGLTARDLTQTQETPVVSEREAPAPAAITVTHGQGETAETGNAESRQPALRLDDSLSLSASEYLAARERDETSAVPAERAVFLEDIRVEDKNGQTRATIGLSADSDYRLYTLENPHRLVVEIANAQSGNPELGSLLSNETPDLVEAVRLGTHDDHLKLVLDLKRPVRIEDDSMNQTHGRTELAIVLDDGRDRELESLPSLAGRLDQEGSEIEAVHHGQMDIEPRENDPASLVQKRYREGLRSYRQGRISESIESLAEAIRLEPRHGEARYLLASAHIRQDRPDRAIALLSQSVELLPENTRIKRLYAQLLYELGQPEEAIRILRTSPPLIDEEMEYYALLAALLRDQARHAEAADIYRSLVRLVPEKSVWWIGLGISLEAVNESAEALNAYRQALNGESLSGDLRQYVSRRIQSLTAEQRT